MPKATRCPHIAFARERESYNEAMNDEMSRLLNGIYDKRPKTIALIASATAATIAVAMAVMASLLYSRSALVNRQPQVPVIARTESPAQVVATLLRNSPVNASQHEIDNMAARLNDSPAIATDAEKQAMTKALDGVQ